MREVYGREVIRTRHWPMEVALSGSGDRAYLLNFHPSRWWWLPHRMSVSVLDAETGRERHVVRLRRSVDGGLAVQPSGTHLFAAAGRDRVSLSTLRGAAGSRGSGSAPGRGRCWPTRAAMRFTWRTQAGAPCRSSRYGARTVVATVRCGRWPCALALAGGRLYVANQGDDSVTVVDVVRRVPIRSVPVGGAPQALCVSPSGDRLYVATRRSAGIRVLRTDPLEPIGIIPLVTGFPRPPILSTGQPAEPEVSTVAVSRDGLHLVVGLFEPGSIQVVDLARERIVDEYNLGCDRFQGPTRIVADPRTDRFYVVCVGPDLTVLC
jgi:YVTN family beta-propeller protein